MSTAAKWMALLVAAAVSTVAGEIGLRLMDGYRLTTQRLVPVVERAGAPSTPVTEWPTEGANAIAAPLIADIPVPAGVDPGWFLTDPAPPPAKAPRPDLETLSESAGNPTLAKFARRIWNINFVLAQARHRESYWEYLKPIRTPLRVFDPADHSEYPRYRMIPDDPHAEAWPTGTFASNNLGYRGRDVSRLKPPQTFRVVFVGASTTIDHYSFSLSFTDYVGHYLNLWARARGLDVQFEAVNTAREGLQSMDLAAVVEQEVLPLSPDVVVYKEGANQFGEAKRLLSVSDSRVKAISPDFLANGVVGGSPGNYHSDARRRFDIVMAGIRPLDEAPRPPYVVNWPAGLSEETPDLSRDDLPMDLSRILRDLGRVHSALKTVGADLAVSSFVWMADEHLRLVPGRANERAIYWYLNGNEVLWPLSYRDIRRFADFQNRTLRAFAEANAAYFVDLARWFPLDPALFIDGIHISYPGVKVHGWITFLQLLPLIERRVADHASTAVVANEGSAEFSTITISEIEERLAANALPLPLPPLSEWKAGSAAVRLTLDASRLIVEGTASRWAYQAVSPDIPVERETYYRVRIPTTVTSGVIGFGVLDETGGTWISSPLDSSEFSFFSGNNTKVQLVVADATPTLGTVSPSRFEIRAPR